MIFSLRSAVLYAEQQIAVGRPRPDFFTDESLHRIGDTTQLLHGGKNGLAVVFRTFTDLGILLCAEKSEVERINCL